MILLGILVCIAVILSIVIPAWPKPPQGSPDPLAVRVKNLHKKTDFYA